MTSRIPRPLLLAALLVGASLAATAQPAIPLPEHPRPDFERAAWVNLNGTWDFQSDAADAGLGADWEERGLPDPRPITVPFPWGSPLSGVRDSAQVGWYARTVEVPEDWDGERVFLVVGASDWETTVWFDGVELGTHRGGYTPFEFELTPHVQPGTAQRLVVRVDDRDRDFKLEGKQGYGNARGIWQTPYLEARGAAPIDVLHFSPDLAGERVHVEASLVEPASEDLTLTLRFPNADLPAVIQRIPRGAEDLAFDVPVPDARLWSLDDPFLYEVEATVEGAGSPDVVDTYFGMREISVVDLPGTDIPYVALNGEPVYLELALDQAYHPEGYYTFPTDDFVRDEVLRAKDIGLNGLRVHIKVPLPRKLYWADRLGMLIMADVPNWWGPPTDEAFAEGEYALREMVKRDFNHPSIFSWITFNETWGLRSRVGDQDVYTPETQARVVEQYRLAKALDPTRLVEDNSVCCDVGHTETDLNSWHAYLPGWEWGAALDRVAEGTYPNGASLWEDGYDAGGQPNINSEFGNVWGYEGSTGDVDYTWDYHRALDAFRRHPEVAGWLYTEHHDVINEWNGYWRYDRSEKITGLDHFVEGMSLADFHAPLYVAVGDSLSRTVAPGQRVEVPLYASFLTGSTAYGDELTLETTFYGWDGLGQRQTYAEERRRVPYRPWMTGDLDPVTLTMPDGPAVAVLATRLLGPAGEVLHRNFSTFVVEGSAPETVTLDGGQRARLASVAPAAFADAAWSQKQWDVLDGLKVNGAGSGYFEYRIAWPEGLDSADVEAATFVAEVSAKELFGKDRDDADEMSGDYMRGLGTLDPGRNPNAYPMTDETRFPSAVLVRANGHVADQWVLEDDPADSRGVLSWHSQLRDRRLREAGSYGQLMHAAVPAEALAEAAETGELVVRLEVDEALPGGLAVYGKRFGRFPLDPTVVFVLR